MIDLHVIRLKTSLIYCQHIEFGKKKQSGRINGIAYTIEVTKNEEIIDLFDVKWDKFKMKGI